MKRLVDLNHGALFEDTSGLVGSAPFKLGDQVCFASPILRFLEYANFSGFIKGLKFV